MHLLRRDKSTSLQDGLVEKIQLVFGEIQLLRHLIFVGRDEALYVLLDQLDGRGLACLAVVAQRAVLALRQLEGDRVILIAAALPFLVLCHNTLI